MYFLLHYFQWVPIFLAVSAFIFCLPRLVWLMSEGGLMSFLAKGATGKCVEDAHEKQALLIDAFTHHLKNRYTNYALTFFVCEQLNTLVLFSVVYLTDAFLQGQVSTSSMQQLRGCDNFFSSHAQSASGEIQYSFPFLLLLFHVPLRLGRYLIWNPFSSETRG